MSVLSAAGSATPLRAQSGRPGARLMAVMQGWGQGWGRGVLVVTGSEKLRTCVAPPPRDLH